MQNKRNKINNLWEKAKRAAGEAFFPRECFFCKKPGALLCADCRQLAEISPVHRPNRGHRHLGDVYTACSYDNLFVQKLIHNFKYEPFYRGLGIPLAGLIADHFALSTPDFPRRDLTLAPVPLAPKRLRWRGFNQAAIIANELGAAWQIPVAGNYLDRTRETENQAGLSGTQRSENIQGAFVCRDRSLVEDKRVFLVDDVVTTGATMDECARVLLKNGAREVIGIAVAGTEN